jgi:6-bladed beta-propeller
VRFYLPSALILGIACATDESRSGVTMRDSAGVRIVESSRPVWDSTTRWQVSPTPTLSIGTVDGAADYQFTRIVGASRFGDSTIAVGDAGSMSIRFFDANGKLVRSVGRMGNGPGEFRTLQSLRRAGDSLDVFDRRVNRMTVFDRGGAVVRTIQLPTGRYVAMHRLTSGRWLAAEEDGFFGGRVHESATPGLHRFPSAAVVLDSTGALLDTVGVFPGAETAYFTVDGHVGSLHAAYGRTLAFATRGDTSYVVTGDFLGFDVHDVEGRRVRSVRATGPDRTLREEDIARFNNAFLAEISDSAARAGFKRALEVAASPPAKAAVGRILVDPRGAIWLSAYENEFMPAPVWFVFDRDNRYLGDVSMPAGLRVLEIGDRYVLGITKDDAGVEVVRVHALAK